MSSQDSIFLEEGDKYYERNKHATFTQDNDAVLKFLSTKAIAFKDVLEIGCSNGARLNQIANSYNANCYGIEPSKDAVEDGTKKFEKVTLLRGVSHDLKAYDDGSFDMVILNYVFHWVDRKKLLLTISEIDRVLQNKGHLIVKDFYPISPHKTEYHHLPKGEAYTYKQNYPEIFTSSNLYHQIHEKIEHHGTGNKSEDDATRVHMVVLEKDIEKVYQVRNAEQ